MRVPKLWTDASLTSGTLSSINFFANGNNCFTQSTNLGLGAPYGNPFN